MSARPIQSSILVGVLAAVVAPAFAGAAPPRPEDPAQDCEPGWSPAIATGEQSLNYQVEALQVFEGALYAGGYFSSAGGVAATGIARLVNGAWEALPGAPTEATVFCMEVFDDGSGPALYIGGEFVTAGEGLHVDLLRWDGEEWSTPNPASSGGVRAMEVFDDGSGSQLYLAGGLRLEPEGPPYNLVRWDGQTFTPISGIVGTTAKGMLAAEENGVPVLYVCGQFNSVDGIESQNLAKWDGEAWAAFEPSLGPGVAESMAFFDDGDGPTLFVGGLFTTNGRRMLAKWDGASWTYHCGTLAFEGGAESLVVFDDGSGAALWVGGAFQRVDNMETYNIIRWSQGAWSPVPGTLLPSGPIPGSCLALAVFDQGDGPELFGAGGRYGSLSSPYISRFLPSYGWVLPGRGPDDDVRTLAQWGEGDEAVMLVGGDFTRPGQGVAAWDGARWSPLSGGGVEGSVRGMKVVDDGSGDALYAAGLFSKAGGVAAKSVARWDGEAWSPLGTGLNSYGAAIELFDDGDGPAIYVGGAFSTAGGQIARKVARWDGENWSALGEGLDNEVVALLAFDDGSGPSLFAAGQFLNAGGASASRVARWNGAAWHPLGDGLPGTVYALEEFDDGTGPALIAGGNFLGFVSKWDGENWTTLGEGLNGRVYDLAVVDDGAGPTLYAVGAFNQIGDEPAARVARWDGAQWRPATHGVQSGAALAIAQWDHGDDPGIVVGGTFATAGQVTSANFAEWRGCEPPPCPADLDGDGFVGFADLNIIISAFNTGGVDLPGDVDGDGDVDFADLNAVVSSFNSPCGG